MTKKNDSGCEMGCAGFADEDSLCHVCVAERTRKAVGEAAMGTGWKPSYEGSREERQERVMAVRYGGKVDVIRVIVTKDRYAGIVGLTVIVPLDRAHIASSLAQAALSQVVGRDVGWRNIASSGTWTHCGRKNGAVFSSMRIS